MYWILEKGQAMVTGGRGDRRTRYVVPVPEKTKRFVSAWLPDTTRSSPGTPYTVPVRLSCGGSAGGRVTRLSPGHTHPPRVWYYGLVISVGRCLTG